MLSLPVRFMLAMSFAGSVLGLCPARPLDEKTDAVTAKLLKARDEYAAELKTFNAAVAAALDRRETAARKAGNKRELDEVKAQRKAYDEAGELPRQLPSGSLAQMRLAVAKFDKVHTNAISELIMLKKDEAAEAVEKERQRFVLDATVQFGKRTYLTALKVSDVRAWNKFFETDSQKGQVDGRVVPHSVLMHPDVKTYANASFQLGGKSGVFRATVGVPKHDPTSGDPASPLTFELLGDDKSLWKSKPVTKLATFQTCVVRVQKVKTLTLRVHCEDAHGGAHAAWLAPFVAE